MNETLSKPSALTLALRYDFLCFFFFSSQVFQDLKTLFFFGEQSQSVNPSGLSSKNSAEKQPTRVREASTVFAVTRSRSLKPVYRTAVRVGTKCKEQHHDIDDDVS